MQEIIVAKKGFLYTDGVATYGKEIIIGEGRSKTEFYEITEEEYVKIFSEQSNENE